MSARTPVQVCATCWFQVEREILPTLALTNEVSRCKRCHALTCSGIWVFPDWGQKWAFPNRSET